MATLEFTGGEYGAKVTYSVVQDTVNNTSSISITKLQFCSFKNSYDAVQIRGNITVDGKDVFNSLSTGTCQALLNGSTYSEANIGSSVQKTVTVTHDASGKKTITIDVSLQVIPISGGMIGYVGGTKDKALAEIPVTTEVTSSSMGARVMCTVTQNAEKNTSTITVSGLEVNSISGYTGGIWVYGTIKIDNTIVLDCGTTGVNCGGNFSKTTYTAVNISGATSRSITVSHGADGRKSISVAVNIWAVSRDNGNTLGSVGGTKSKGLAANPLKRSISITTKNATVTIKRLKSPRAAASTGSITVNTSIFDGDELAAYYTFPTGYTDDVVTFNNVTVGYGESYTVSSDVTVTVIGKVIGAVYIGGNMYQPYIGGNQYVPYIYSGGEWKICG